VELLRSFPLTPLAPGEARRALEELGAAVEAEIFQDLRIVVTELVMNTVRQWGARAGDSVQLRVQVGADRVRVEVLHEGDGYSRAPPGAGGHGRGLLMIERLASRWGVEPGPGTKMWVELALRAPWKVAGLESGTPETPSVPGASRRAS
jgi:two-component sensor histidine kinase